MSTTKENELTTPTPPNEKAPAPNPKSELPDKIPDFPGETSGGGTGTQPTGQ
jgi:hypothetical protein